jgi:hypothetical protein
MLTPSQLARLAAWVKITPETHRHLFNVNFHYITPLLPDPTDPAADAREVDRVWLADVWHTLCLAGDTPQIHGYTSLQLASVSGVNYKRSNASATLALLLAARTAGVPEVVEAMGAINTLD